MDGHKFCLCPEPGWLVAGAQELGTHIVGGWKGVVSGDGDQGASSSADTQTGRGQVQKTSEACAQPLLTPLLLTLPVPAPWGVPINSLREVEGEDSLQLHSTANQPRHYTQNILSAIAQSQLLPVSNSQKGPGPTQSKYAVVPIHTTVSGMVVVMEAFDPLPLCS